jgi:transformation/transcription domain-associated protein
MSVVKKQAMAAAATQSMTANHPSQLSGDIKRDSDQPMRDATSDEDQAQKSPSVADTTKTSQTSLPASQPSSEVTHGSSGATPSIVAPPAQSPSDGAPAQPKQPWEYVDEILNVMKTGHPLMVLTIETMVDQILQRFKATPEEEIYRLVCMLLGDAVQVNRLEVLCCAITDTYSHRVTPLGLRQWTMMDSLPP